MKRCAVILILLAALFHQQSRASVTDWVWNFGGRTHFGVSPSASDGYDPLDIADSSEYQYHIAVNHEYSPPIWGDPSGFYRQDIRTTLELQAGTTATRRIYLWCDTTVPEEAWYLALPWSFADQPYGPVFEVIAFTLKYVRPAEGMPSEWTPPFGYSPPVGTVISLDENQEGNWMFPIYRTDNGLDGYVFDLTATVIPEPSALAALLCGLGGVLLRRQR